VADQGRWFKLWISALSDPHLDNLAVADFGRWAKMGTYIKEQGTDGVLTIHPPSRTLCSKLQVSDFDELLTVLQKFPHCSLRRDDSTVSPETNVTVTFHNWLKYQGDYSTARVRKFREMKRSKRRGEEKRGEEKNISSLRTPAKAEMTVTEFTESWNEICGSEGLALVEEMPNGRKAKVTSRLRRYPKLEFWQRVFNGIITSDYLMGKKTDWKASFDWLIKNDTNPLKVVEGTYD